MLKKINLAHLPTPIEPMERLGAVVGASRLFIKRDDQTGLALGGNKTRKLEYLLAEAQDAGAHTLITTGAIQSNHCRQTAAAAASAGMDCILVLVGSPPEKVSGNLFLDQLFGAQVVWTGRPERDEVLRQIFLEAKSQGKRPHLIPYGGSSPTGAAAYAMAIKEVLDQGLHPDWIVFASSSGGTQAGMIAGAKLFAFGGKILGISVDEPADGLINVVHQLAGETCRHLGRPETIHPTEVLVNDDYLGGGYAVMGEPEQEAIRLLARHEGLLVDPVYTGRAAAGLIDLIRQGFFQAQDQILFWHTGGTPALFADKYTALI